MHLQALRMTDAQAIFYMFQIVKPPSFGHNVLIFVQKNPEKRPATSVLLNLASIHLP